MNGLDITESEFRQLPVKEQNTILYKNVRDIRTTFKTHTDEDKKSFNKVMFTQRLHWWGIGILALLFGVGKYFGII